MRGWPKVRLTPQECRAIKVADRIGDAINGLPVDEVNGLLLAMVANFIAKGDEVEEELAEATALLSKMTMDYAEKRKEPN